MEPPNSSHAANRQELADEQRTVLEVYSRTHAGLVPDAIHAVLASHDAMLGALEQIAQLDVIAWNPDGSIAYESEAGRLARSVVVDPRSSGNPDKKGSEA